MEEKERQQERKESDEGKKEMDILPEEDKQGAKKRGG